MRRRTLVIVLALVATTLAALVIYPPLRERWCVSRLDSDDLGTRMRAARWLGASRSSAAIPKLIERIADAPLAKSGLTYAGEALAEIGSAATPALRAALVAADARDERKLRAVLQTIDAIGEVDGAMVAAALRFFSFSDERTRFLVRKVLAHAGPASMPTLMQLAGTGELHTRVLALRAIGTFHAVECQDFLVELCQHEERRVRSAAADALAMTGSNAFPTLRALLDSDSVETQGMAWRALAAMEHDAVPLAVDLLARDDVVVRRRAAGLLLGKNRALVRFAAELFRALQSEGDETVRSSLTKALAGAGPEILPAAIQALAATTDDELRTSLIDLIANQNAAAASLVAPTLTDAPSDEYRIAVLRILRRVHAKQRKPDGQLAVFADPTLLTPVTDLLFTGDAAVRAQAVKTLRTFATPAELMPRLTREQLPDGWKPPTLPDAAVQTLSRLVADESSDVRTEAALGLGALAVPEAAAVPPLIALLKTQRGTDDDPLVGGALARMGAVAALPLVEAALEADVGRCRLFLRPLKRMGQTAEPVVARLVPLLETTEVRIRRRAANAFGYLRIDSPFARIRLEATLQDHDPRVRQYAAIALVANGATSTDAVMRALELLASRDAVVDRDNVRDVIASLGAEAMPALLEEGLQSSSPIVRLEVRKVLARIGTPAVEPLIVLLQNGRGRTLHAAGEALYAVGSAAVPALLDVSESANEALRIYAIFTLARLGALNESAVPAILLALRDTNPHVQADALTVAGKLGTRVVPELEELVDDAPDAHTRELAARALDAAKYARESYQAHVATLLHGETQRLEERARLEDIDALASMLLSGGTAEIKAAVTELRRRGGCPTTALPALVKIIGHEDRELSRTVGNIVRHCAADAVPALLAEIATASADRRLPLLNAACAGTWKEEAFAVQLIHLVDDEDPAVRTTTIRCLSRRLPRDAMKRILTRKLADPVIDVRVTAIKALPAAERSGDELFRCLEPAFDDDAESVRLAAMKALQSRRLDETRDAFADVLLRGIHEGSASARLAVLGMLGRLGPLPDAAIPVLQDILENGGLNDRVYAVASLVNCGERGVPAFVHALEHGDAAVRASSCIALEQMGTNARDALPALEKAAEGADADVARHARRAIERIRTAIR